MTLKTQIITVDIWAGTSIQEAVQDAIKLAADCKCTVKFEFNDIWLEVVGTSAAITVLAWWGEIKEAELKANGACVTLAGIKWGSTGR